MNSSYALILLLLAVIIYFLAQMQRRPTEPTKVVYLRQPPVYPVWNQLPVWRRPFLWGRRWGPRRRRYWRPRRRRRIFI